jgi:hypothetical protein
MTAAWLIAVECAEDTYPSPLMVRAETFRGSLAVVDQTALLELVI